MSRFFTSITAIGTVFGLIPAIAYGERVVIRGDFTISPMRMVWFDQSGRSESPAVKAGGAVLQIVAIGIGLVDGRAAVVVAVETEVARSIVVAGAIVGPDVAIAIEGVDDGATVGSSDAGEGEVAVTVGAGVDGIAVTITVVAAVVLAGVVTVGVGVAVGVPVTVGLVIRVAVAVVTGTSE